MCGIFGILNHKELNKDLFNVSLELLSPRDPENKIVFQGLL